jgi:hypothetical protein
MQCVECFAGETETGRGDGVEVGEELNSEFGWEDRGQGTNGRS